MGPEGQDRIAGSYAPTRLDDALENIANRSAVPFDIYAGRVCRRRFQDLGLLHLPLAGRRNNPSITDQLYI